MDQKILEYNLNIIKNFIINGGDKRKAMECFEHVHIFIHGIILDNKAHRSLYNSFVCDFKNIFKELMIEKKEDIKNMFKETLVEYDENKHEKIMVNVKSMEDGLNKQNIDIKTPIIETPMIVEPTITQLRVLFYSDHSQNHTTLSNYFKKNIIEISNEYYQIQLEDYLTFHMANHPHVSTTKTETEIVLFVQLCCGSRLDRDFKDQIEKLKKDNNKKIIFVALIVGEKSNPISIDNFNGPKVFFKTHQQNVYDNDFNRNQLEFLCNLILKPINSKTNK